MGPLFRPAIRPRCIPAYPPLGLSSGGVKSFTGYVVRLGSAFSVPAPVLLTHSLGGIARLTGQGGTLRLSFHGLVDMLHLVDRDLESLLGRYGANGWGRPARPC